MSKIKNWSLVTIRDFLFAKYGYGMRKKEWEYYTGEGEVISKEQHLAFEVGLASGKRFYPKAEYNEAFCVSGYAEKYGYSRLEQPVLRSNEKVGGIILTSTLRWIEKEGDIIKISTKSGSLYELENMIRGKDYLSPENANMNADELDEILYKYFKFNEEVVPA